jgi:hypothetical protein
LKREYDEPLSYLLQSQLVPVHQGWVVQVDNIKTHVESTLGSVLEAGI